MLFTLLDLFVLSFSSRMMNKNGRSRNTSGQTQEKEYYNNNSWYGQEQL